MRRAKFLDVWVKRDRLHANRSVHVVVEEKAVAAAENAGATDVVPLSKPIIIAKVDRLATKLFQGVVNLYAVGIDSYPYG
jgi:hypothetical protein